MASVNPQSEYPSPDEGVEIWVPPDRPGVLSELVALVNEMVVSLHSLEIISTVEGDFAILVVTAPMVRTVSDALAAGSFRVLDAPPHVRATHGEFYSARPASRDVGEL
jgi:hypothetical protein